MEVSKVGRYGCHFDGRDEEDMMVRRGGREGGKEGGQGGREGGREGGAYLKISILLMYLKGRLMNPERVRMSRKEVWLGTYLGREGGREGGKEGGVSLHGGKKMKASASTGTRGGGD